VIILASVLAVLVAGFLVFYLHSRTPEWGDSEARRAALRMMVVIGPIFGMHYREPRPDLPAVTSVEPHRETLLPMRDKDED
jgi:hypothetical protein